MNYLIRELHQEEIGVLDEFLYEAIYIPKGYKGEVPRDIIYTNPLIYASIKDFGSHPDDYCFVAEVDGEIVGAVWVGIAEEYGHMDNSTPSFSISLYKEYRGQGIGTALMKRMLQLLQEKGYERASLGVNKENYAVKMYQKVGFKIVGDGADETEWLMVHSLGHDNTTPMSAKNYDSKISDTIPYYEEFSKQVIDIVKQMSLKEICWLDLGCGTGTLVSQAASVFSKAEFTLADPSEKMLAIAKEKTSQCRAEYSCVPSAEITFEDKFQVVTAIQSHHYMQVAERELATKRIYHALKQGGIYLTFENVIPECAEQKEFELRRWGDYQLAHGKTEEEVEKHLSRCGVNYFPITVEQHRKLLLETGFKSIHLFWRSYMQMGMYAIK